MIARLSAIARLSSLAANRLLLPLAAHADRLVGLGGGRRFLAPASGSRPVSDSRSSAGVMVVFSCSAQRFGAARGSAAVAPRPQPLGGGRRVDPVGQRDEDRVVAGDRPGDVGNPARSSALATRLADPGGVLEHQQIARRDDRVDPFGEQAVELGRGVAGLDLVGHDIADRPVAPHLDRAKLVEVAADRRLGRGDPGQRQPRRPLPPGCRRGASRSQSAIIRWRWPFDNAFMPRPRGRSSCRCLRR